MEKMENILFEIERKKQVKILYACETGSRAWGFPSPDSDYDIRFIYMHEVDWYLSLSQKKDTIEHMDGDLDITGWDLKKSLSLLKKSNATLIERFQSPIQYYEVPGFSVEFRRLVESYYSPTAVFFHHYSLAKKFREELGDKTEFKLKSFFYMLRSLLSCHWIILDSSVLPMHIEGLMRHTDENIRERIRKLIELKAGVGEKYLHKKDGFLDEWVMDSFETIEKGRQNLGVSKTGISPLNEFFLKMLYAKADN
jgi:predicted nucleotidyltransferase